ncbi:MAG: TadE/TadG family type IV pilus assembly protein [Gemmataceae bacterium]
MRLLPNRKHRTGTAAVEFAVVLTFILAPTLIGVWEVGRLVQVQQIVSNSAREGARLAAQAVTIGSDGSRTQIQTSAGTPNVTRVVYQYLVLNGLSGLQPSDVTTTFQFLTGSQAGNTNADPYLGSKGDQFQVTVTIPYSKVGWTTIGLVNPQTISFTVNWTMLVDDPFTINSALPSW